jgi:hypothetical protein
LPTLAPWFSNIGWQWDISTRTGGLSKARIIVNDTFFSDFPGSHGADYRRVYHINTWIFY